MWHAPGYWCQIVCFCESFNHVFEMLEQKKHIWIFRRDLGLVHIFRFSMKKSRADYSMNLFNYSLFPVILFTFPRFKVESKIPRWINVIMVFRLKVSQFGMYFILSTAHWIFVENSILKRAFPLLVWIKRETSWFQRAILCVV